MTRKEITKKLSAVLEYSLNPNCDPRFYIAKEVTFDYASVHPVRVDYMKFKPVNNTVSGIEKGDFYCYEIKSSVADFKSKNGHNFIGDYNYYVMTAETYSQVKELVPYDIGVFTIDEKELMHEATCDYEWLSHCECCLKTAKLAHRHNRNKSVSEMLLMMFRSANRENIKRNKAIKKEQINVFLEKTIENNNKGD